MVTVIDAPRPRSLSATMNVEPESGPCAERQRLFLRFAEAVAAFGHELANEGVYPHSRQRVVSALRDKERAHRDLRSHEQSHGCLPRRLRSVRRIA